MLQMMSIEYTVPSTIVGVPFNLQLIDLIFIANSALERQIVYGQSFLRHLMVKCLVALPHNIVLANQKD